MALVCSCALRAPKGTSQQNSQINFAHIGISGDCNSCHAAGNTFAAFPATGHIDIGAKDCSACHNISGWSLGALFDHTPVPATCANCHGAGAASAAVPNGIVNQMAHSANWLPDCVECHTVSVGVSWSGAVYSHNPVPPACIDCHLPNRPVGPVGSTNFDHGTTQGQGDCKSCHLQNMGMTWSNGSFNHSPVPSSCVNCHLGERPTTVVSEMNHSLVNLPDCALCHAAHPGVSWTDGVYSHSPTPSSCDVCHSAQRPVGAVGSPPFDHANGGTGDCVNCHKSNIGSSWAGGMFAHSSSLSSCNVCHMPDMPLTVVKEMYHPHTGLPDCKGCHTANLGVSWSGGTFSHPNNLLTSCQDCHEGNRPRNHHVGQDCIGCHRPGRSWSN